ncbi:MAG TPA: DNA-formamidopyrimidine glycosylase family protein [Polyangia bacterium]
MPELPDLVHVEAKLGEAISGWEVTAVRIGDPTVLRIMVPGELEAALVGKTITAIERRGHFMLFAFGPPLAMAVNCMLAGRFFLASPADKSPRALGLALGLRAPKSQGAATVELRYVDDRRMGKVYVAPSDRLSEIPQLGNLGVDLLSPGFTLELFRGLARKRRDQVRAFLMDKSALASIGNAYADEILFAARIHPKTFVRKLTPEEIDRLYEQINLVTQRAIEEIAKRDEDIDVKVRDFLAVRGRDGKPCPVCTTTLRAVRVGDGDAVFCPKCQPATRALFVDWSKLPKTE